MEQGIDNRITDTLSQNDFVKKSVGLEFIEWAEKYWLLDKLIKIDNPDNFSGESCDYNYMRDIFIRKINSIVSERISGDENSTLTQKL